MNARAGDPVDILLVSLGSTAGLRAVDGALVDSMRRAGARVAVAAARPTRTVRTLALTDLKWALAARRAAEAELSRLTPTAVIYSTCTAALLWPRPGAIRFDATSAANRPGRHGLWQRPLERRRLCSASLLLPQSEGALRELPGGQVAGVPAIVVPVPVEPSGPIGEPGAPAVGAGEEPGMRDVAAVTYAANPHKKGLDRVLEAWRAARRPGEELVVAGVGEEDLRSAGYRLGGEDGVRVAGLLVPGEYRKLLRRARVFICAPRREDYGMAQLEALADGCCLVTTPAPGPYVGLPIARALDARLVGDDLAAALRTALDDPLRGYAARAREALHPFTHEAVDRVVAEQLLPSLLG
jgi:glycosyltransferase involved in cell wall biosynthesis